MQFQDHQRSESSRTDTLFDAARPGGRNRLSEQTPPRFLIVDRLEPLGQRARIRHMLDAKTVLFGPDDDASDIQRQQQDPRGRTGPIGLCAQDSPTGLDGPFEDFKPRWFRHAASLHRPALEENELPARLKVPADNDAAERVRPDGLAVRRRRHDRGWSARELTAAIESASFESSGLRRSLTPSRLKAIEEQGEEIPYDELLLLAGGLDCDPVDLIAEGELSSQRIGRRLN